MPDGAHDAVDGVPFSSVGFHVSSLGYAVSRRFAARLAPLGLEPRHFLVLRAVDVEPGQTQQALAERLLIPPSRMVAILDALEARGLVERRSRPEDRRSRALHLTGAGGELVGQGTAIALGLEREMCGGLSDDERSLLIELLGRVADRLGIHRGAHAASGEL